MPVTPEFLAAREAEHRNRLLAHLPRPAALELPVLRPRRGWRRWLRALRFPFPALRFEIVHLTELHCLELTVAGNAFFTAREPLLGDVQLFLWRLHPLFRRPDGSFPNQPAERILTAAHHRAAARARRRIARLVPHLCLFAAAHALTAYLATTRQDFQGGDSAPAGTRAHSRLLPEPCYWDDLCDHAMETWHMSRAEVLNTPRALLFQLHRNRLLRAPEGHLEVFAPSDRLTS